MDTKSNPPRARWSVSAALTASIVCVLFVTMKTHLREEQPWLLQTIIISAGGQAQADTDAGLLQNKGPQCEASVSQSEGGTQELLVI